MGATWCSSLWHTNNLMNTKHKPHAQVEVAPHYFYRFYSIRMHNIHLSCVPHFLLSPKPRKLKGYGVWDNHRIVWTWSMVSGSHDLCPRPSTCEFHHQGIGFFIQKTQLTPVRRLMAVRCRGSKRLGWCRKMVGKFRHVSLSLSLYTWNLNQIKLA